ncbi:MAG: class I SAM-dependent methyltransferase [bacterium]
MVYVNPCLDSKSVVSLYDENYFSGNGFDKSIDYGKEFENNAGTVNLIDWDLSTVEEIAGAKRDGKSKLKFLDAGSGLGLALYKADQKGFNAIGLEVSKYACSFVESKNLRVINSTLEEVDFDKEKFDIVFMREVIEHLESPKAALKKIFGLMNQGGVLFITTGNYDCPERKIKGKNWQYFMPEGHLNIFSSRTMKKFLEETGFRKILVTNQGDLLMNFLLRMKIIEPDKFKPANIFRRIVFEFVRFVNHFISSGLRVYAVK